MVAAGSWRPSRSKRAARTSQRDADRGGVAGVVEVADCQSEVIERGQRVAVFGLKSGQIGRQVDLVGAVAAVLGDHQTPAQGVQRADGIGVAESEAVGEQRKREPTGCRLPRRPRSDHSRQPSPPHRNRPIVSAMTRACPGECVGVAAACELGAAPLDHRSGWPMYRYTPPSQPSMPYGHLIAATAENRLAGVAVADRRLDPSGRVALRRHHVQRTRAAGWSTARAGSMSSSAQAIGS